MHRRHWTSYNSHRSLIQALYRLGLLAGIPAHSSSHQSPSPLGCLVFSSCMTAATVLLQQTRRCCPLSAAFCSTIVTFLCLLQGLPLHVCILIFLRKHARVQTISMIHHKRSLDRQSFSLLPCLVLCLYCSRESSMAA